MSGSVIQDPVLRAGTARLITKTTILMPNTIQATRSSFRSFALSPWNKRQLRLDTVKVWGVPLLTSRVGTASEDRKDLNV